MKNNHSRLKEKKQLKSTLILNLEYASKYSEEPNFVLFICQHFEKIINVFGRTICQQVANCCSLFSIYGSIYNKKHSRISCHR